MPVSPKKVILLGDPIYREFPLQALDVYGNGKVLPGMLVEITSAGEVKPESHAAGANVFPRFAVELPAREGQDINTYYDEDGETVLTARCRPGDHAYALLEVGANVALGAFLESNGAGSLQAVSTGRVVAMALEAVNNSAGSAPARIRVEAQ